MEQTEQKFSYKNILILLLLLAVMALGAIMFLNNRNSISKNQYDALNDSISSFRDKEGKHNAHVQVLEFQRAKDLIKLQTNDSTIKWLQKTMKEFKGEVRAAIVIGIQTASQGSHTTHVLPGDTVYSGDTVKLYPRYVSKWSNKWEVGEILATKDSTTHKIKINNELEIVTGYKKDRWIFFNSPELNVNIKNLNPNTITQEVKSFSVKNEDSRFGLGGSVGVTLHSDLSIRPYLGVGINYTLIKFKKWRKR